jgi:hypothetical protein
MVILLFWVLLSVLTGIAGKSLGQWMPVYSFGISVILALLIYPYMKNLAIKETKPYIQKRPHPLKGLTYGVMAFMPVILIELLYPLVSFDSDELMKLKLGILKVLLCPVYWIVNLFGDTALSYILASSVVPLIAMLGYLGGFYGIDLGKYFIRAKKSLSRRELP